MMKIEEIAGDIVLIVLENYDPLKKIGINQDKIFVEVKGYDENGIWIHHPNFAMPKLSENGKAKELEASILVPWVFVVSIAHFPGAEGLDFPSPFSRSIGF